MKQYLSYHFLKPVFFLFIAFFTDSVAMAQHGNFAGAVNTGKNFLQPANLLWIAVAIAATVIVATLVKQIAGGGKNRMYDVE